MVGVRLRAAESLGPIAHEPQSGARLGDGLRGSSARIQGSSVHDARSLIRWMHKHEANVTLRRQSGLSSANGGRARSFGCSCVAPRFSPQARQFLSTSVHPDPGRGSDTQTSRLRRGRAGDRPAGFLSAAPLHPAERLRFGPGALYAHSGADDPGRVVAFLPRDGSSHDAELGRHGGRGAAVPGDGLVGQYLPRTGSDAHYHRDQPHWRQPARHA